VWARAIQLKCENLFTEIVGRGDVVLEDNATAFAQIGDYGAHCLLFYSEFEDLLAKRRQMAANYVGQRRTTLGTKLSDGVAAAIRAMVSSTKTKGLVSTAKWAQTITELERNFRETSWLMEMVQNVQSRATTTIIRGILIAVLRPKMHIV